MTGATLDLCRALSGVSVEAVVTYGRQRFREKVLFTHRGLSGPAILQISSYWRAGESIVIDLVPDREPLDFLVQRRRVRPRAELKTVMAELIPGRLAAALANQEPAGPIGSFSTRMLGRVVTQLKRWELVPSGSEGWSKAEVTAGGIDTTELSSQTMAARDVPGLYVIGEAVDVTGWLGGYNFQWAWSSGWCAGVAI
jgi:predicted Rossmann fold flavoprotein